MELIVQRTSALIHKKIPGVRRPAQANNRQLRADREQRLAYHQAAVPQISRAVYRSIEVRAAMEPIRNEVIAIASITVFGSPARLVIEIQN
jgi:hypothetical protein